MTGDPAFIPESTKPETSEAVELLPCPFCGSAEVVFVENKDDDGPWVAVACLGCGVGSRQHYPVMDDAEPHARSAWNTRAALSAPPAGQNVERMREGWREVEMMVVLERIAQLLGSAWIKSSNAKIVEELGDEITPLFEGIGMSIAEGASGQDCYGFDWTAEQDAAAQQMGGHKAIFRRIALEKPRPVGEPAVQSDTFDLLTGKPVEPWAQDMIDKRTPPSVAIGAGEAASWAVAAESAAMDAYAQHMGDPEGNDDVAAAKEAAARTIEAHARAALAPASASIPADVERAIGALIDEADRARRIWRPRGHETATQHARLDCAVRGARAALAARPSTPQAKYAPSILDRTPRTHPYKPHAKFPWFCDVCGYAEHERLQHPAPATPQANDGTSIPDGEEGA